MIFYLEFGSDHKHLHNEKELNRDTLGVIYAPNERQAEWFATRTFNDDWQMIFPEKITDNKFLEQYSGGLIVLNPKK